MEILNSCDITVSDISMNNSTIDIDIDDDNNDMIKYNELCEKYVLNFRFKDNGKKFSDVWKHFRLFDVDFVQMNIQNKTDILKLLNRYNERAICMICYEEKVLLYNKTKIIDLNNNDNNNNDFAIHDNSNNNSITTLCSSSSSSSSSAPIFNITTTSSVGDYNKNHVTRKKQDNSKILLEPITFYYPKSCSTTSLSRHLQQHSVVISTKAEKQLEKYVKASTSTSNNSNKGKLYEFSS